MSADHEYHPFYCEENAWWLCQHPALGEGKREVVFISNAARQCLLLAQRAAPEGQPILWDYHVIVIADGRVWDLDTRLGMPVSVADYLDATFPELPPERRHLAPRFRIVAADELVAKFGTDRSHMRTPSGGWHKPPPPWEPPSGPAGANQTRFFDLDDDVAGEIVDLPALYARYSR